MRRILFIGLLAAASMGAATAGSASTWTEKAGMPTGKMSLSSSVVDGVIYTFGGRTGGTDASDIEVFASAEAYDPQTDSWTALADMPTPRFWHGSGTVDGIVYVVGGNSNASNDSFLPLSTVEAYDPAANTWTARANLPTARYGLTISVVDGILYAIGGRRNQSNVSTVEAYDPATDTWTAVAEMPTPRPFSASSVVDGKVYVFGGLDNIGGGRLTVEVYDPATDAWTTQSDLPTRRAVFSASTVDGLIYVIGGAAGFVTNYAGVPTVDVYDPGTDNWATASDMLTARARLATSVVDGTIYAIGGGLQWPTDAFPTVEAMTPTSATAVEAASWGIVKALVAR